MSKSLICLWTLQPENPPYPIIPCKNCGCLKPFKPSGKFRLNANGTKLDAWLIYKCTTCDATWNRPIFERRSRRQIAPDLLEALQINCPQQLRNIAFDKSGLPAIASPDETSVDVQNQVLSGEEHEWTHLEIRMKATKPVGLRLDRLLAQELGVSRNALQKLARQGILSAHTGTSLHLKRPPKDGTIVYLQLAGQPALKAQINSVVFATEAAG